MSAKKSQKNGPVSQENEQTDFAQALLEWNNTMNFRQMPWKGEKDPYKIWLSEVILQQTRVEQGLEYYRSFIRNFPDIDSLALASDQEVFKLWEGLGYYSRCKNLLQAARYISNELNGVFPDNYEDILQLKGVGSYTASAIASFAYNLPYAVLDGNVFRVLSRIRGIDIPVDSKEGKMVFNSHAQQNLPQNRAGEYNQAIMDFGATVCKPVPHCPECFFKSSCVAYQEGLQLSLPVKAKKPGLKERWFNYAVVRYKDQYAIRERSRKDIWQHLYEFLLVETPQPLSLNEMQQSIASQYNIDKNNYEVVFSKKANTQKLTHQKIFYHFFILELNDKILPEGFMYVSQSLLTKYPFPKTLKGFIVDELKG
jgi:A/G-specific adenine glycosylase